MTIRQSPFAMVPIEAASDHRLTAMQYRVLIAILSFRNKNSDTAYPRRELIANRCGYSINSISRITAQLVDLGWLQKSGKGGRSSPSTYKITVPETVADPETVSDPATVADPDTKTLADPDTKTVADPARGKEQTSEQKGNRHAARANGVACPQGVSKSVWSDFLSHRRSIRARLTETAWKRMEPELRALEGEGWSADDVLAEAMAAGWRAFKADWIRKRCQQTKADTEVHWE